MHEGHRKRMLEKILKDADILSDHELLEILLFYAIPRKNTNEIAHNLIDTFGSLKGVFTAQENSLREVEGIGESTAAIIIAIGQVIKRIFDDANKLPKLYSFENYIEILRKTFSVFEEEKFLVLYFDKKGKILQKRVFSSHSHYVVSFDLSKLVTGIASLKPYGMLICHNHLSGDPEPSNSDDISTKKVCVVGRINDVELFDHIIIAGDNYYSYSRSGRLDLLKKNAELLI